MVFLRILFSFWKDREYRSLLFASVGILVLGTIVYHYVEKWSWLDSLYFSTITLTTIGYGDFAPQTDVGKAFTIVYIAIGIGLVFAFINTIYKHFQKFPSPMGKGKTKK